MGNENLPSSGDDNSSGSGGDRFLAINELHYHANDIAELRRLSEVDPDLARTVVENEDKKSQRAAASYKFGIGASVVLLVMAFASVIILVVFAGILSTLGLIGVILVLALLIRVILTGKWSDTTVLGKAISFLARCLGSSGDNAED